MGNAVNKPTGKLLFEAIETGDSRQVERVFNACKNEEEQKKIACFRNLNEGNKTALHLAAQKGEYPTLKLLLAYGGGKLVQITDNSQETPIHVAVRKNSVECLKLLVAAAVQTNVKILSITNLMGDTAKDIAYTKPNRQECMEVLSGPVNGFSSQTWHKKKKTSKTISSFNSTAGKFSAQTISSIKISNTNDMPTMKKTDIEWTGKGLEESGMSDLTKFVQADLIPFFHSKGSANSVSTSTETADTIKIFSEYIPIVGKVVKLIVDICGLIKKRKENEELSKQFELRYLVIKDVIVENCQQKLGVGKLKAIQNLVEVMQKLKKIINDQYNKYYMVQILTSPSFKKEYDVLDKLVCQNLQVLQVGMSNEALNKLNAIIPSITSIKDTVDSVKAQMDLLDVKMNTKSNKSSMEKIMSDVEIPMNEIERLDELPIAAGGQGKIYRARYAGETVAEKVIETDGYLGGLKEKEKRFKDFKREVSCLTKLRHPRIIRIFGIVTTRPNELSLIMVYAKGGDLRNFLDNTDKEMNKNTRLKLMFDIAQGMAHLHRQNILHRDLKSLNILIDHTGSALVSDFGLSFAKDLASMSTKSKSRTGLGSARWMAPEYLRGDSYQYNEACDMFSYGVIIYEIVTRKLPWSTLGEAQIIAQVAYNHRRPELNPFITDDKAFDDLISAGIKAVLSNAWDREPNKRPTFPKLLAELREVKAVL
eukprot:g7859.t1